MYFNLVKVLMGARFWLSHVFLGADREIILKIGKQINCPSFLKKKINRPSQHWHDHSIKGSLICFLNKKLKCNSIPTPSFAT